MSTKLYAGLRNIHACAFDINQCIGAILINTLHLKNRHVFVSTFGYGHWYGHAKLTH